MTGYRLGTDQTMCIVTGDSMFIDSNCKAEMMISSRVKFFMQFLVLTFCTPYQYHCQATCCGWAG